MGQLVLGNPGTSPGLEPRRVTGLSLGDPLGMALECHPPRPHPWKGRRRYSLGVLAWPLQPADRGACSRWSSGAPSPSPGTRQGKRPPRVALAWPLSPRTGRDLRFSNPPPRSSVALRCPSPTSRPGKRSCQVTAGIGQCGTSDQPSLAPGWKILETPGCGAQVLRPPPRDRKGPATPGVGVGGARAAPSPRPVRDWKRGKGSAGVRGTRKAAAGWRPNGGVSAAQEPQQ